MKRIFYLGSHVKAGRGWASTSRTYGSQNGEPLISAPAQACATHSPPAAWLLEPFAGDLHSRLEHPPPLSWAQAPESFLTITSQAGEPG